jgi:type II secretory pathway pseudopilin PulG
MEKLKEQAGFTIIEVVVIAPMILLTMSAVVASMITMINTQSSSRAKMDIIQSQQTALSTIETDATLASQFLHAIDSSFSDAYGPDSAGSSWTIGSSSSSTQNLIMRAYATDTSPKDPTKTAVYIDDMGCSSPDIYANPALTTNIIYFVRDNTLYRRVLTDTSKSTCAAQFQRQSCPPDIASPVASCKAKDSALLAGVSSFKIDYFAGPNDSTSLNAYSSNDLVETATTVNITITNTRVSSGETISRSTSMRISKLN